MKNKFFISLILVALASGIFWGWAYGQDIPRGDGIRNDKLALLILEKGFFNQEELMNHNTDRPLYPLFMAIIYKIFGQNYLIIRFAHLFLFILIVILVYRLTRLVFNERLAKLAGILIALAYPIASFIGWFYREIFFCFLLVLLIYCLYKAQLTHKNIWFIFSGVVLGLATLTSVILAVFPLLVIIGFLILAGRKGLKNIYPQLTIFFIAFSLVVAPWVISSYLNFGQFFFSAGSGQIFPQRIERMKAINDNYLAHLVGNTLGDFFAYQWFADYDPRESRHGWEAWQRWINLINSGMNRNEVDRILNQEARIEALKHPWMYLKLTLIDFLKFNTPLTPNVDMQAMFAKTHPELSDFAKAAIILSIRFLYWIFFGLIIYALVKKIRQKEWAQIGWLVLIILYFNLIFSNLLAHGRYSMPIYPFYIILSAIGLLAVWDKLRNSFVVLQKTNK